MKKVLYILLVISLSLEFASCSSSDDEPYLNIENESVIITHDDTHGNIKIKTNQKWTIINNSDWLRTNANESGNGNFSISYSCWPNELYKDRKATIIIKTESFYKEILITQTGNLKFRPGPFAILKSFKVFAKYNGSSHYRHSGYIISYREKPSERLLRFIGYPDEYPITKNKKPILKATLGIEGLEPYVFDFAIYLNNAKENMTIEDGIKSFLKPYNIYFDDTNAVVPTYSNVRDNVNLKTSRNGNIITYTFMNFQASAKNYSFAHYTLDGIMEFELLID